MNHVVSEVFSGVPFFLCCAGEPLTLSAGRPVFLFHSRRDAIVGPWTVSSREFRIEHVNALYAAF